MCEKCNSAKALLCEIVADRMAERPERTRTIEPIWKNAVVTLMTTILVETTDHAVDDEAGQTAAYERIRVAASKLDTDAIRYFMLGCDGLEAMFAAVRKLGEAEMSVRAVAGDPVANEIVEFVTAEEGLAQKLGEALGRPVMVISEASPGKGGAGGPYIH